jgi:hypothetical protein
MHIEMTGGRGGLKRRRRRNRRRKRRKKMPRWRRKRHHSLLLGQYLLPCDDFTPDEGTSRHEQDVLADAAQNVRDG